MKHLRILALVFSVLFISCKADDEASVWDGPQLIIRLKFDKDQIRLNNLGQPSVVGEGHAAQSPIVNGMSLHYIELAPTAATLLGDGQVLYVGGETNMGGAKAIDFSKAFVVGNGQGFLRIPLIDVKEGNYDWVRVSVSYQNGTIKYLANGIERDGTIASFLGYNNYIGTFDINGQSVVVNDNKLQGFWAFESMGYVLQGQAPPGAVTVPNPLFSTSPIPQGSCVLTGQFADGLHITGNETKDITVDLSFSVNNSVEWNEVNADGKFEPQAGETLTDMGLRGLIPFVTY